MKPQYKLALADISAGIGNWQLWGRLGWLDVKRRYRRTTVGPFWTAFNLATLVFTVGFLWAALFGAPAANYVPFLATGVLIWQFINTVIGEGATVFTAGQGLLTTIRIPQTLLVSAMVWRNLIVFFHNMSVFVIVMLIWHVPITWSTLLVIPGILLLSLNGIWVGLLLGLITTRFRDLPQFIVGIMQIVMFLTPVMWSPEIFKGRQLMMRFIDLNPFYHIIQIVREPMLGRVPGMESWLVSALLLVAGGWFTLFVFSRFRQRIPYWL